MVCSGLYMIYDVVFEGVHGEDTCERGLRLDHVYSSWESDEGPEKGPLMFNVSISLYLSSSGWVIYDASWHLAHVMVSLAEFI